jgi:V/A-type H+/Na+-transporting ATPase subunit D
MAARNVAPTKSNLLGIRQELELAKQGYDLLDQKRNILVIELLSLVDQAADFENRVREAIAEAYHNLEEAVLSGGRLALTHLSSAVNVSASIELSARKVMGVRLPVANTSFSEHAPYFSPAGSTFRVDQAIESFKGVLSDIGRLAELKVSIMRLAHETRRTIRKVNALEKIAIPELRETVTMIQDRLEESERDMFVLMKMVKSRLEAKER